MLIIIGIFLFSFLYFAIGFDNSVIEGEIIFKREGCAGCHKFKGKGGLIGPDLTSTSETRSDRWIKNKIKNPAKDNPDTRMPSYGHLSRKEIKALIRYLKS